LAFSSTILSTSSSSGLSLFSFWSLCLVIRVFFQ
jgi:hypothetical protein